MEEILRKTFTNPFGDVFEAIAVPLETSPDKKRPKWVFTIIRNSTDVLETKVVFSKKNAERLIQWWENTAKKIGPEEFMRIVRHRKNGVWYLIFEENVYVGGNTYPLKEELKALGFRWDSGYSLWKAKTEKVDFEKLKALGIKEFKVESND